MQPLGHLLLYVAFFGTLATALTAYYGAHTRNAVLVRGARFGVYGLAMLYLAMALVLWHGYFTHDYTNKYIATYSDNGMPLVYLFTSFWGGEKGALLFWTTVLTVFSAIAVHQARTRDVAYVGWAAAILMSAVFFFDILMVFASNPFETYLTNFGPKDGKGLNPLLQNPTMAIHPPSLLTGYIAFTLPFAFGAASLITNRLDDQWAKDTRKWTIVSWLFLTVGLVLGGLWAYQELGWGGFWMWDPVENAGLIPWFTATAFLHSIVVQERRGMLRRWNFSLVCLTFLLTIFGTFLTRSQLIVSIHAFADSELSSYFLVYMAVITAVSVSLLWWRWDALRSPRRIDSFMSREAFFVLNNVMLVLCAFVVLWGTLYSKISGAESFQSGYNAIVGTVNKLGFGLEELHQAQELGEPWFNRIMVPFGVVLLFLTAVGPLIAWRRTTLKSLKNVFLWPAVLAAVPVLLGSIGVIIFRSYEFAAVLNGSFMDGYNKWLTTLVSWDIYAFCTIWFAAFVFTGVGLEFWRGGKIRQKSKGGSILTNMATLTLKAKRRYGGYIIHIGMALAFLGFAGAAFKDEAPETPLHLGDSVQCGNYKMTFTTMQDGFSDNGYVETKATLVVLQPGETVPTAEVERVVEYLEENDYGPFHVETRPDSAKIKVQLADRRARARIREALYLTGSMRERFSIVREEPKNNRIWFTFRDQKMIRIFPPLIHKQINDVRRVLGSLATGRATVETKPGQAAFSLMWETQADYDRVRDLLRQESPALEGVLLARVNPVEDSLEIVTAGTGYLLHPEVRRYAKQGTPTTEVDIWHRPWADVYVAMRPDLSQPFVQLIAVVNPMIQLLWIGTVIMFLGGVFLLIPTELVSAGARRVAMVTQVDTTVIK